jgi:hypothetical protein
MNTLAKEFKQAVTSKDINVICLKRFLEIGDKLVWLEHDKIDEVFRKITEKIASDIRNFYRQMSLIPIE